MGELDAVNTERPFQSMNAVDSTSAKLRTCASDWRGFPREDSIMARMEVVVVARTEVQRGRRSREVIELE